MEPPLSRPIDHILLGDPTAPALIGRERTLSVGELESAVARLAGWLAARQLGEGARVATWLPKTLIAALMPIATPRAGLVHVPINPLLKRTQVAHIMADSGAALLITQAERAATLEEGDVPEGAVVAVETGDGDALPPSKASADTLAALLYTSGSTGLPKGVMLSHANLWLGAEAVATYLKLTPEDRVLAVLPFAFDYGQNQLFSTWFAGGAVAPLDYLVPRDVITAVARVGATTLAGVPPLWHQLVEADWPADTAAMMKRLTNSGGALGERLVRALRSRFPAADLYAMYGLTEAFRSTWLDPALIDTHPDAVGRAIPHAEVLVVRGDGTRADVGEAGELVHAGPLVAHGYWRDPVRTAARFRSAPAFSAWGGTAVWSGDTMVEDADGLLRFVARADEMIKSAGNRISPTEVEAAILVGDEVQEAVVVGVPDAALGQVVIAIVVGDRDQELCLRNRLRALLPGFQQPVRYIWQDALPRNANGKLDRVAIKAGLTE